MPRFLPLFAALLVLSLRATASNPISFAAPVQFTTGGQTIVKIVTGLQTPVLDANINDTGADAFTPLDIDGDGTSGDFVTADHDSKLIRVWLAPAGGGTNYGHYDFTAGNSPTDLAVADLDGDGKLDIITVENGNLVVYLNTTTGGTVSFGSGTQVPALDENGSALSLNKVTAADVDHDGKPDLVGVGTIGLPSITSRLQVAVFRNTTTSAQQGLTFASERVYGAQGSGDFVAAADLTQNGAGSTLDPFPEIIVGSNNGDFANGNSNNNSGHGTFTVFLNKGDGTYGSDSDANTAAQPITTYTLLHIHAMAVGDLNADGKRDLLFEDGDAGGGSSADLFLDLWEGNGDGTFGSSGSPTAAAFLGTNSAGTLFQGDLALADFNGDGKIDVAVTDPLHTGGVLVFPLDPTVGGTDFFVTPNTNKVAVATGAGAQALGVLEANGGGVPDLLVANDDPNDLTLLHNTTAGSSTLPPGDTVAFGAPVVNTAGDQITIPVLRGSASSGQVLAFYSEGGTAQEYANGKIPADYSLSPLNVTFPAPPDPAANVQDITIQIAPTRSAVLKTIVLTLLEPVGNGEVGTPATVTIPIRGGKAAILKAPAGLVVAPTNTYSPARGVTVGIIGSPFNFAVLEAPVPGVSDLSVSVEAASDPQNGPWTTVQTLTEKGSKWTGSTPDLPSDTTELYFRARAKAAGFTDGVSAPSRGIFVIAGPELALNVQGTTTSDASGETIHLGTSFPSEQIAYHCTIANVGDGDAGNVVVNLPLPTHTTFAGATASNGGRASLVTKHGAVVAATLTFAKIPAHTTYTGVLYLNLDLASDFSAKDPTKGFGYVVKETGFTINGSLYGLISGHETTTLGTNLVHEIDTTVLGPISMNVSADKTTVKPGDVITYTIQADNVSGVTLSNGFVEDHLPAGTILETLYAPVSTTDADSTGSTLPNPGPYSNPQIIYARNPSGPSVSLDGITDPVTLVLAASYLKAKATTEFDFVALQTQAVAKGASVSQFEDAVNQLVAAEAVVPVAIKWPIPSIEANGHVTLNFQVRVLYDLLKVSQTDPNGVPASIANNNYDFQIAADGKNLSALYGKKAPALTTALDLTAPAAEPVIALGKIALGDATLADPNVKGNGAQVIAGLGKVTTAVQDHGFDFELYYANTGTNDAHDVVIHETVPSGAVLLGFFMQSVDDQDFAPMVSEQLSFYNAAGSLIPNSAVGNLSTVRSMDIRLSANNNLSPLAAGHHGIIRYTIQPVVAPALPGKPPVFIQSMGGYDPTRKRSDPLQGAYITCADLSITVPATPDSTLVKVVHDVSFSLTYSKGAYSAVPGDYVPFDFTMTQNGDATTTAGNATPTLIIPAGATLATDSQHAPAYTDGTAGGPGVNVQGQKASLTFGNIPGQTTHTFRIYLMVNSIGGNLDPALKAKHRLYFDTDPTVTYQLILPAAHGFDRHTVKTTAVTTLSSSATTKQAVQLSDAAPAKLSISRTSPYTITPGGKISYVITFANAGETDATNVNVGMQVPFYTTFARTANGTITPKGGLPTPVATAYTTTPRTNADVLKATGGGPDIITWHIGTLPAHATGSITLAVQQVATYVNDCVRDHSLYISAGNAASAVLAPNPIGTWVVGKNFDTSKWEVLGCFCEHLGITINAATAPALQAYVETLTQDSKVHAVGGLDFLQLQEGPMLFPTGGNQVLVVALAGTAGVTTAAGSHIINQDGNGLIATGDANAITISGLTGGTQNCNYLLAHALDIVAQGGGNIVAAGGGNLVSNSSGTFQLLSNDNTAAPITFSPVTAGIVAAGGGNAISTGFGQTLPAGVLPDQPDGPVGSAASLIGQDGSSLVSNSSGTLVTVNTANVISNDGGSVVSNDGGSLVSNSSGTLVSNSSGTLKGGPGN